MVKEGIITSSLLPIPKQVKARCRAMVPFVVATPYLKLQYFAKLFSNSSTYFPFEEIHFVLTQPVTYSSSFSHVNG